MSDKPVPQDLAKVLELAQRSGIAHNNGAGGQYLLCATAAQLMSFYAALASHPAVPEGWRPTLALRKVLRDCRFSAADIDEIVRLVVLELARAPTPPKE